MNEEEKIPLPLSLATIYLVLSELLGREAILAIHSIRELVVIEEDDPAASMITTMGVNYEGKIYINRAFWNKYMYNEDSLKTVLFHEILHHVCGDVQKMKEFEKEDPEHEIKCAALNLATDCRNNAYIYRYLPDVNSGDFFRGFYSDEVTSREPLLKLLKPDSNDIEAGPIRDIYDFLYKSVDHKDLVYADDLYELILEELRKRPKIAKMIVKILLGSHSDGSQEGNSLGEGIEISIDGTDESQTIPKELADAIKEKIRESGILAGKSDKLTSMILADIYDTHHKIDLDLLKRWSFNHIFQNCRIQSTVKTGKWTSSPITPFSFAKSDIWAMLMDWDPLLWKHQTYHEEFDKKLLPIYLDVSGSMWDDLPYVIKLVANIHESLDYVWGFSNMVAHHTIDDLKNKRIKSTGGTDFDCIIAHAIENKFRNIIVITDGYASCKNYVNQKVPLLDDVVVILTSSSPAKENYFSKVYKNSHTLDEVTL